MVIKKLRIVGGHDLFSWELVEDGFKLVGENGTTFSTEEYCSKTSNDSKNGIACGALAKTDPDYFKNIGN